MSSSTQIVTDATLSRQLSRLRLTEDSPPSVEEWQKLLKSLNAHYKHVDEDRDMMARSLEVSTEEMMQVREAVAGERDALKRTLQLVHEALEDFASACRETRNSGGEDATAITGSRKRFNMAVVSLLASARESSAEYRELLNALRMSFVSVFEEVMTIVNPDMAVTESVIELQSLLVPSAYVEERDGLLVSAHCAQLVGVGGDMWGVRYLSSGQILLYIGDATGHGALAGFFTSAIAASLNAWLETQAVLELERVGKRLNQWVTQLGMGHIFMTWCGVLISADRQTALVLNAGHSFPMVLRQGSSQSVVVQGNPLGSSTDAMMRIGRIRLESGDRLLLYTDGITERAHELHGEYGERRLRKLFESLAGEGEAGVVRQIWEEVVAYGAGEKMTDDATLVVATIR